MTRFVVMLAVWLGGACATAPTPKMPDERHRVPVNRVIPEEVGGGNAAPKKEVVRKWTKQQGVGIQWRSEE